MPPLPGLLGQPCCQTMRPVCIGCGCQRVTLPIVDPPASYTGCACGPPPGIWVPRSALASLEVIDLCQEITNTTAGDSRDDGHRDTDDDCGNSGIGDPWEAPEDPWEDTHMSASCDSRTSFGDAIDAINSCEGYWV